jgi:hypothetical protein
MLKITRSSSMLLTPGVTARTNLVVLVVSRDGALQPSKKNFTPRVWEKKAGGSC